jgi:hypothetical protein
MAVFILPAAPMAQRYRRSATLLIDMDLRMAEAAASLPRCAAAIVLVVATANIEAATINLRMAKTPHPEAKPMRICYIMGYFVA